MLTIRIPGAIIRVHIAEVLHKLPGVHCMVPGHLKDMISMITKSGLKYTLIYAEWNVGNNNI